MRNIFRHGRILIIFLLSFSMSACDSDTYWEDDTYIVAWVDTGDNVMVYRKLGDGASIARIVPEVVAVASDNKYLTARVRPIGAAINVYYYLVKSLDNDFLNGNEIAIGPLSEMEFEAKREILHFPEPVDF